ncbi:hypothetical protein MHBO_003254 [Bonamia ostreae]|uniref:LTD domain-containing protein n=1 Tax=Bonamia ostreae TaxID=126728 RepID=A0ABV2APY9_9EUKA
MNENDEKSKNGEKPQTKNPKNENGDEEDFILECCAGSTRIDIKNQSEGDVNVEGWSLKREESNLVKSLNFPSSLKQNESFYVYPTKALMKEDVSEGIKKVWAPAAFDSEKGCVIIVNENGSEMYKMEINEKEDVF